MKKAFEQIKKYWLINLVAFIVSIAVGAGIFCLFFFLRNKTLLDAVDGSALAAIVVLFSGLLLWVSHLGAFDTFAFGFKQLGSMIFAKDARRDGTFYEYKEAKNEKRADSSYLFVSVIIAGLALSIALIVLEIVYHTSL